MQTSHFPPHPSQIPIGYILAGRMCLVFAFCAFYKAHPNAVAMPWARACLVHTFGIFLWLAQSLRLRHKWLGFICAKHKHQ